MTTRGEGIVDPSQQTEQQVVSVNQEEYATDGRTRRRAWHGCAKGGEFQTFKKMLDGAEMKLIPKPTLGLILRVKVSSAGRLRTGMSLD